MTKLDAREKPLRIVIQNGKVKDNSVEFATFRQLYSSSWGGIVTVLGRLESMLSRYEVPVAFIDPDKLVTSFIDNCSLFILGQQI